LLYSAVIVKSNITANPVCHDWIMVVTLSFMILLRKKQELPHTFWERVLNLQVRNPEDGAPASWNGKLP